MNSKQYELPSLNILSYGRFLCFFKMKGMLEILQHLAIPQGQLEIALKCWSLQGVASFANKNPECALVKLCSLNLPHWFKMFILQYVYYLHICIYAGVQETWDLCMPHVCGVAPFDSRLTYLVLLHTGSVCKALALQFLTRSFVCRGKN